MDKKVLYLKLVKNKSNSQFTVVIPKKKLGLVKGDEPKYLKIKGDGDFFEF